MTTSKEPSGQEGHSRAPRKKSFAESWRAYWHRPSNRLTLFIIITNVALVAATIALYCATRDLVDDAKHSGERQATLISESNSLNRAALISANRAWIAPRDLTFEEPPVSTTAFHLKLSYENIGREPALNIAFNYDIVVIPVEQMPDGNRGFKIPRNDRCDGLKPAEGNWTVYPAVRANYDNRFWSNRLVSLEDVEAAKSFVVANICFAYTTFSEPRESAICYVLQRVPDKKPTQWFWAFCPSGHWAK